MSIVEWRSLYSKEHHERLDSPEVVIYAGGSPKRKDIITKIFPQIPVVGMSGGEELDSPEVGQIADGKINHVCAALPENIDPDNQNLVIIAADTRTRTLQPNHTEAYLKSQGKPESLEKVQESFSLMHQSVTIYNLYPIYFVDAATGFLHFPSKAKRNKTQTTAIGLNQDHVARLATEKGFTNYLKEFEEFYRSDPYENSGYKPMSVFDLAAGFSLPVLYRMGAVNNINGVGISELDFPKTFKKAMYNVAVGVHPEILSCICLNPQNTIDGWEWLNQVTDYCLQAK